MTRYAVLLLLAMAAWLLPPRPPLPVEPPAGVVMQSSLPAPAGAKQSKPLLWVDPPGLPDGGVPTAEPTADCVVIDKITVAYPMPPHGTLFDIRVLCMAYDQLPPGGES